MRIQKDFCPKMDVNRPVDTSDGSMGVEVDFRNQLETLLLVRAVQYRTMSNDGQNS